MQELLARLIPLDLTTIFLSPLVFALTLTVLGGKNYNIKRAGALLLGMICVCAGVVFLGILFGQKIQFSSQPKITSAIFDLLIGLFFLAASLKFYIDKNYQIKTHDDKKADLTKWFGISVFLEITNFGALIICFNATSFVVSANISFIIKIVLHLLNIFCFSLSALLPLLFYVLFPCSSKKILPNFNSYFLKNIRIIVIIIFGLFGFLFLSKGITFFI